MASAALGHSLRRRPRVVSVVSGIVVVVGVLAMHSISAGSQCTAATSISMTPAHAPTEHPVTSTMQMYGEHTDATAHEVSDCVATPTRKVVPPVGVLPALILALGALTTGEISRHWRIARLPSRLSVVGGLRR